ncbi:MAG: lytic murein transglycosylase [Pseudomonadota bacterium]
MTAFAPRAGLVGAALALALPGCSPSPIQAQETAPVTVDASPAPRPDRARVAADFVAWRDGFRARALARGIRADVFDRAFAGLSPDPEVIERDRFQPEFRRQIWDYLDRAITQRRISAGQEMLARHGDLLRAIEARYGVDHQVVLAIWGLESAYGSFMGDMNVIRSLATLAHDGRRRDFGESQLLSALAILQAGDIPAARMLGSWAGAMGHTQFIPTSFEEYAVDWTGDGRRDIWSADPADALASAANYLARFGWQKGLPWGVEVTLPAGFDVALTGGQTWRSTESWASLGVRRIGGAPLGGLGEVALIAPAGTRGPVFAITRNFRVIRRYNNATSYALAVGHLSDRLLGAGPFVADWPRDEAALSVDETIALQKLLTARGFDTQGADGLIGPNSITAIRAYQRSQGLAPDGFPTRKLLDRLRTGG